MRWVLAFFALIGALLFWTTPEHSRPDIEQRIVLACHSRADMIGLLDLIEQQKFSAAHERLKRVGFSQKAPCFNAVIGKVKNFEVVKKYHSLDFTDASDGWSYYRVEVVVVRVEYEDGKTRYIILQDVTGYGRTA